MIGLVAMVIAWIYKKVNIFLKNLQKGVDFI